MDTQENSLDDYLVRFGKMVQEAREHGVHSVVILLEHDLINDIETVACRRSLGPTMALGMVRSAAVEFEKQIMETIDQSAI